MFAFKLFQKQEVEPVVNSDGSLFKCPLTKILKVEDHPNADRLSVCTVYGFQVVTQKDKFHVGDLAVYIPIDSILDSRLEAQLFPKDSKIILHKSRVRQIRIRKFVSQGMLIHPSEFGGLLEIFKEEDDLARVIGVTKYEPPACKQGEPGQPRLRNRPKENPHFRKFNGVTNLKWMPHRFEGEEVVIQEKVHGCIRNNETIELVDGSKKTIQEIVENKLNVEVWGYNEIEKKIVPTKVINWFNNGITKSWLSVKYSKKGAGRGHHYRTLEVTPNHKFYLVQKNEYVPAEYLNPGDKVLFKREDHDINYIQEQILIGKMLGDGSLNREAKNIQFGHKKDYEYYLDYTLESLGHLGGNRSKNQFSGYGTEMVRGKTISSNAISDLFENWFVENKKEVPKEIIEKLGPISIAFWYMDDGSLSHHEDQEDRANFAVCGFEENSVDNLIGGLKKFNISAIKFQSDNGTNKKHWRLRINSDDAEKMFLLIAPYITKDMRYKLPERYRDFPFIKLPIFVDKYKKKLVEQTILSVEKCEDNNSKNLNRYDIETETHNFFCNDILVHNSHIRFGKAPFAANTFMKKLKKLFGLAPKYEFVYGSNNVELTNRKGYTGFYGGDIYGECLAKYNVVDKIKDGEFVHAEIYGPGIQANYDYSTKEHKLIIFDVRTLNEDGTQEWLTPEECESYAAARGFDFVPVLYRGMFDANTLSNLTVGPSVLDPKTKVREGVVVKSRHNYDIEQNKQCLKSINPDYLADVSNTDNH